MSSTLRRGGSAVAMTWDPKHDPADAGFLELLRSKRFLSIERAASEETSIGWVTPGDPTGDTFELEDLDAGGCWWLRFRMDAKKLPASKLQMEITAHERTRGKRLSARERRELKDHLHEQLLPGILPRTTFVDVVLSSDRKRALVLSSSKKAREAFTELVNGSFGFYPEPVAPGVLAGRMIGDDKVAKLIRTTWPGSGPRQRELPLSGDFLGDEFLLWLWSECEQGGEFSSYEGTVGIVVHDLVAFDAETDATSLVLKHGLTTRATEARAALRDGRVPTRLRLLIAEGTRQWIATVDGSLSIGSCKLPDDPEDCESNEDRTSERAANWLRLRAIVEHLFGTFVDLRVSDEWPERCDEIAGWMQSGAEKPAGGAS